MPVKYRAITVYNVLGWTFCAFPLKATGLLRSFCLNLLATINLRRPPGVWRWSSIHKTTQVRGNRAMAAVSSKLPYCWLSSCRARSTSDIHWATGLYLLAHSRRNPPPHPIITCTSWRWAVGTSSLVLLVVWFCSAIYPTSRPIFASIHEGRERPIICSAKAWDATFSLVRIIIFREGSTVISPEIIAAAARVLPGTKHSTDGAVSLAF